MKNLKINLKKISLFDILIICVILFSLLFLAFFLLRRTRYINVVIKVTNKNILYTANNPPSWFAEYFKEGMIGKNSIGQTVAIIKKVLSYDTSTTEKALYLTINLKADYSKGENKYSYEGNPLLIGAPIKIEFQNVLAEGLVTYLEGVKDVREDREILTETQIMWYQQVFPETNGIPAFLAEAINVNDEVKDSLGNVLIKIVDKKVEPAKKITTNSLGNVFVVNDPLKKDVYLTLKLKVKKINNDYYLFDDVKVKVGGSIPVHLSNISIYPNITKILAVY